MTKLAVCVWVLGVGAAGDGAGKGAGGSTQQHRARRSLSPPRPGRAQGPGGVSDSQTQTDRHVHACIDTYRRKAMPVPDLQDCVLQVPRTIPTLPFRRVDACFRRRADEIGGSGRRGGRCERRSSESGIWKRKWERRRREELPRRAP
eukprot:3591156-Rhodomonas_salina.2